MLPSMRTLIARRERGFTLVELMITVAVIGVLALLATVGYARYIRTAKAAEATSMLAAIGVQQDAYRAETHHYSDASGGNLDVYYPTENPKLGKVAWDTASCTTDPCKGFRTLNVKSDGPVYYRYSTIAGPGDGAPRTIDGRSFTANEPWFMAKARGDLNQDGVDGFYWIASFQGQVWHKNPDE